SHSGIAHVAFDHEYSLRSRDFIISWLDPTPHAQAVYASCAALAPPHATLASRRPAMALPGPDLHRLIAPALPGAFFHSITSSARVSSAASWCLSVVSPIAPDIAWIDMLRRLVLASVGIARQRGLKSRITPVRAVLAVILCWRPPRVPRRRKIAAVVVIVVVGWALLGADAVAEWTRRDAVIAAAGSISVLPPDQLILGVLDVAAAVDAEAFGDRPSARALHVAGLEVDCFAGKMAFGLGRRRGKRNLRGDIGPHRLDDRLEDRHGDVAASRAAAERAALAIGVVVADPNRDGDVVGEAHEPGVVLPVGGAGLARDVGGKAGNRARRAPRQHALQHGLELIEGGAIDRGDHHRRFRIMAIDHDAVALDGIDHMRRRVQAFIRDGRI